MDAHDWWHLVVLGTTLLGAAGALVLALVPVVFDEPPPGLQRFRPLVIGLIAAAAVLFLAEWLGIH